MHTPRAGRELYGPGWYWQPEGAERAEYLAYNSIEAEFRLRELVAQVAAVVGAIAGVAA